MNTALDDHAPTATPPAPRTRTHHAGHVIAIVVGCLALFPALGMLVGGAGILVAEEAATDDDGFYAFTLDRLGSDGVAVTTSELWFDDDDGGPWVLDWLDLDVRLRVDGAAGSDDVFVGIARRADIETYLSGSRHSTVTELDDHTPVYRQVDGERRVGAPSTQSFWVASATGPGEQQLDWEARGGRWAIVVMNADGSPGLAADVEIGARSDAVTPIAVGLLVTGGIIAVAAVGLIVLGARGGRRRDRDDETTGVSTGVSTGPFLEPERTPAG